ncbi:MAG: PAS domain-containing protein [Hyphomicrobiales bacterium]|uniref:two-component system sensor histidine kinase NtrB n=1 Tax=Rhabdaerophilum calidifontis TaxID=2604328 RepID=UPI00123A2D67|nr:ATP-binding protein [Rhabdaerophilum calidifontis]MCA1952124.1 PAS domain-containing protein [Hyphomicrobiales bacterium]
MAAISRERSVSRNLIEAMPMPVVELDAGDHVVFANSAAEQMLGHGRGRLREKRIAEILPPGSPLIGLVEHVRAHGGSVTEYGIDFSASRGGRPDQVADVYGAPLAEEGGVLLVIQPRAIMDKMNRQLTHRDAARSVGAMASMLAHEIKNPLSGIRGAAQLIERSLPEAEKPLSTLIRAEVDRIVRLVERFEVFSDGRPLPLAPVNIHEVLDHVSRLASSGFAAHIQFEHRFDPSLPEIGANRDRLVQALLNLVKNAAEAIGENAEDGRIILSTAFRPGVSVMMPTSAQRVALPFEVCVYDNGPGVPEHLLPHLFEPFVTSKASGTGLGLALVAKVVSDHGGVIECERLKGQTLFRILLPMHHDRER